MNFIAKTIRENRESKGYSLKELANRTFLSVSTIKQAENGSLFVSFEEYLTIFYVLNMISPDFL
ncbi:MAG TPA: helix-turn-helix transcriptional regulator [Candidatus Stercorousia faecigallinarum]|nr:helix-turn-helix transcriptional regulator [Candidatus Stercorousia faecigallinarum]